MSRQSDAARLLAIGLLNLADDEGYFYADPRTVRNHLRQQDDDSRITHGALNDLSKIGYISITDHATHGPIGKVIAFLSHQVINRPTASKIKELYDSGSAHGAFNEDSPPERKGKERKGRDQGTGKGIGTLEEFKDFAASLGLPENDGIFFFQDCEEKGWKRGKDPIKDWRMSMQKWKTAGWLPSQKNQPINHKPKFVRPGIDEQIEIPSL